MKILWSLVAFWIGIAIQAPTRDDSKPDWLLVQTEDKDVTEDIDDSDEKDAIEHEDNKKRTAGKDYSYGDNLTASGEERLILKKAKGCSVVNTNDGQLSPAGCHNVLKLSPDTIQWVLNNAEFVLGPGQDRIAEFLASQKI